VVGGGGTDLLDLTLGESIGLVVMANGIIERVLDRGGGAQVVLASAALFGNDRSQTLMEEYLTLDIARRLDALPCLQAVVLGHGHGGVTVTSVLAALDGNYGDRIAGVAVDRTTMLYDRPAREVPERATLFNVFQQDEGWHGEPIDQPNVVNMDRSGAMAPIAPSEGGGGPAPADHKTLDDAPEVQREVIDSVLFWYGSR
jgi:pimeloyl-ACP methyl ester carboxylesterase